MNNSCEEIWIEEKQKYVPFEILFKEYMIKHNKLNFL